MLSCVGGARMGVNHFFSALAISVLFLHALFILWVIFGTLLTRSRPILRWLHIVSLVWGMLTELLLLQSSSWRFLAGGSSAHAEHLPARLSATNPSQYSTSPTSRRINRSTGWSCSTAETTFSSLQARDADSAILNLEQGERVNGWGRLIFHVADADALWRRFNELGFEPAKPQNASIANAQALGAGHVFVLILRDAYPINLLNVVQNIPEVCSIFCATANPVEVIVAKTEQGRGVMGVIDGSSPKGVEGPAEIAARKEFLRKIGYKR